MAHSDWKHCPVDGTRYFTRSEAYPHGRPPGARFCSGSCAAQAGDRNEPHAADASIGAYYVPVVDGTLGDGYERANGGPQLNSYGELARGGMVDLYKGNIL